ncbi:elongation factor G [Beutenbergia cavernae]|uniref:GTP-binding protein n=1 Tax=Beutenbergia cavernae TaxID=84757 RepID=UPI0005B79B23
MPYLNLGIVAHVDAGKTSLTERLLYDAGVVDAPGSVDAGTTRTDSMDLERRRGITIRAAVTSFPVDDVTVTVIDTPGHPDFIAEVERSLAVLDAAVLVLSCVEGVQSQTVVLWRALRRLRIPTALFLNKVDRAAADVERTLAQVRRRLDADLVTLTRAEHVGTREARVHAVPLTDASVVEAVAAADDSVLARWVDGAPVRARQVRHALRRGVRAGTLVPVVCGSAITGAGTGMLRQVLTDVLPRAPRREGPDDGGPAATVFAVDRDDRGRRAWLRSWSGTIRVRDRVSLSGRAPELVTEIAVSGASGLHAADEVRAGEVAVVRGPTTSRIGDTVGRPPVRQEYRFTPPTLQSLVEPVDPAQRTALYAALTDLADSDPLIGLRLDETDGEAAVSLHGEVQREVVAALLEEQFGVRARFTSTSTICLERVVGVGEAVEQISAGGNPYLAGIGLRVEPLPVDSGVRFSPGIERGNLPPAFIAATEAGVRAGLRAGPSGWAVTDCLVTMTASGYYPRQSHAHQKFNKAMSSVGADFRNLAPVVLHAALASAGTQVCRPFDAFELDLPERTLGSVAALLGRLSAATTASTAERGSVRLLGHVPSAHVDALARALPDLTAGEAVLVTRLDHHAPVPRGTEPPIRRRTGPDPRDREGWFRDVPR